MPLTETKGIMPSKNVAFVIGLALIIFIYYFTDFKSE